MEEELVRNEEVQQQPDPIESTEQEASEQVVEAKAVHSSPQESWKALRDRTERAERDSYEAQKIAQAALKRAQELESIRNTPPEEDYSVTIKDDDFAEGKHLGKINRKMDKQINELREELKQLKQQTSQQALTTQLKVQFSDFDSVVNEENLGMLSRDYPELAATVGNSNIDLYGKGVSAYTLIKKLGIMEDKAETQRIKDNTSKPKPVASITPQTGNSPLSRANPFAQGLTEDLKKSLYREMQEARKKR